MYNLNLYSINIQNGRSLKALPGFVALNAPKNCARGRENDSLVFLVNLTGQINIPPDNLQEWLLKKSDIFYKTPGTVTGAIKHFVEGLNTDLLERNLRKAKDGSQVNGSLNLAVVRKEMVYYLNVGQAKTYVFSQDETFEVSDAENHERGLGVNQALFWQFSQFEMKEEDGFLFSPVPNKTWNVTSLKGGARLSIDVLGRRLFNESAGNVQGALIRLTSGSGQLLAEVLAPSTQAGAEAVMEPAPVMISESLPTSKVDTVQSVTTDTKISEVKPVASKEEQDLNTNAVINEPVSAPSAPYTRSVQSTVKTRPAIRPSAQDDFKVKVGHAITSVEIKSEKVKAGFSRLLGKVFPGVGNSPIHLSSALKLIISIAVPVLVVIIAASVYVNKGKAQQFELFFLQGQQYALLAEDPSLDAPTRLANLQQSIVWLNKAAAYGHSDESDALRLKIQSELDQMEGVVRLKLAALTDGGPLGKVNITQMVAVNDDVYLLDDISGRALRYSKTSAGYEQDAGFDCGPNLENPLNTIGKLVDILPMSAGNTYAATIFAIDAAGNIEFCTPGKSGTSAVIQPPDMGWGKIAAASISQNYLYVLDTGGNAVYRYEGNTDGKFEEKPTLYFDNQVPPLSTAIDIEVNQDELYILRSTGEMVECTYGPMKDYKPTKCQDPAPYGDMRTGQTPQPISFPDARFIQMRMTSAPDSSIYLLDANAKTLYHLSLQRNLQKILHPRFPAGANGAKLTPTAIAISSGKIVFIAFGNQVFYGTLP